MELLLSFGLRLYLGWVVLADIKKPIDEPNLILVHLVVCHVGHRSLVAWLCKLMTRVDDLGCMPGILWEEEGNRVQCIRCGFVSVAFWLVCEGGGLADVGGTVRELHCSLNVAWLLQIKHQIISK